jgi:pimeloyl-ACP methyl ester carboxylesterase
MSYFLALLVLIIVTLHAYRQSWAYRTLEPIYFGELDGDIYRAGDTYIAIRAGHEQSQKTIICVPGYVENMRYFQALYADVDCQLILLNNSDYHCPFKSEAITTLAWEDNPHPLGTIPHEAFRLGQLIREFASGTNIILHGHSRGGAIVLDAARQFPELVRQQDKQISAILEAPVLPGGLLAHDGSKPLKAMIASYLTPIALGRGRHTTAEQLDKIPFMQPTNAHKTDICLSVFSNAKHYLTNVTNMRDIQHWQRTVGDDVYAHYSQITVVVGERDDVLDNTTIIASAERGQQLNPGITLLQTANTNHFVTLEQPQYLLDLVRDADQANSSEIG